MKLSRIAGASILIGGLTVLLRRATQRRPDWYDEPLPDQSSFVDRPALRRGLRPVSVPIGWRIEVVPPRRDPR